MIVHHELLQMVAEEGKHTFISTGMSTHEDINAAVDIFRDANCPSNCTNSTYSMSDEDANYALSKPSVNVINVMLAIVAMKVVSFSALLRRWV